MSKNGTDTLRDITRWLGFISSLLVFILGIVHVVDSSAALDFPKGKFTADINSLQWRDRLFTFKPDPFADHWTPLFMGLLGCMWHFENLEWPKVMSSFLKYFLWMFLTAMFGCIGYNGGLGIIFSIPVFLTCLLSLILFFMEDGGASLRLDKRLRSHAGR